MTRNALMGWGAALLVVLVAVGSEPRQEWQLRRSGDPDMVNFHIKSFKPGQGSWSSSNDVPFSRFHGLTSETLNHAGAVKFEYVSDAGKLVCQGHLTWASSSGTFTFVPNPGFVDDLKKLGYNAPDDRQLLALTMFGVSVDFARAMKEAGLNPTVKDLLDIEGRGVTLAFMRTVHNAGYNGFTARDLVDLRDNGVDIEFLRDLKSGGWNFSARDLIELRMNGVDSEFATALKKAGYELSARGIANLRSNGVPAEFVQEAKAMGYEFTADELVKLRNNGVDSDYLRRMHESGMRSLSASEIVKLRQNGVD